MQPNGKRAQPDQHAPDHSGADDKHLLRAARDDLTRFAPIYERYIDRIFAYCRHRVGAQDAEDVTSQVFTQAMIGLEGYRGGSVAAWLFRIAHNCVIDHLRRRRSDIALDETGPLTAAGPDLIEPIMRAEELALVRQIVAELSDEQANLLALKLVSGLTAADIGAVVGKSAVAVRVELHRLIKQVRARYRALERTGES